MVARDCYHVKTFCSKLALVKGAIAYLTIDDLEQDYHRIIRYCTTPSAATFAIRLPLHSQLQLQL